MFSALKCGSEVTIFNKDKVEIGKGKATSSSQGWVGVQVVSGTLYDEMMKHPELLICETLKYTSLKFNEYFGNFLCINFTDEYSETVTDLFTGISAVDSFNLKFGICNERFKDYPGFRQYEWSEND